MKRHMVVTSEAPFFPSPVLIAPTHGGMTRLSGAEWDGIPAKGRHQFHY